MPLSGQAYVCVQGGGGMGRGLAIDAAWARGGLRQQGP